MTTPLAIVLGLLISAIVMFAINKPRMDVVALIMLTALPLFGIITMNQALAGFSDANIILIAALFVIGEGLVRTGVAQQLGDWLIVRAGSSEIVLLVLLMLVVCALGSIMSSTAVTAIFIPVAWRIAHSTGTAPSKLMMPLSFAALISGMMTLVATAPNLVVNSELIRAGANKGFHFFSFTPFGAVILVLGVIYMAFARHWLPTSKNDSAEGAQPSLADWIEKYGLVNREYRLRVTSESPAIGKCLRDLGLRENSGANVVAIERSARFSSHLIRPDETTELQAGDVLLIDLFGRNASIETFVRQFGMEMLPVSGVYFNDRTQGIGMVEVIVPPDSRWVGKSIVDARIRSRFGLTVIGLRRGGVAIDSALSNIKLSVGDTLLLVGRWKDIARMQSDRADVVVVQLPSEFQEILPAAGKAPQAVACLLLVVGLMISGVVPNVLAALIGCLLMGLFRCIDMNSAYDSINWKTLVLIVGMLPFSIALQETGGVELAAQGLMSVIGESGHRAILAALFAITAMLGMFISNTATAVLMAPVALAIAKDLKLSPYPFAMTVALAASTAFMTPVSSPVNTLVVGPGNYSFGDFVRIGVPFSLVVLVVTVLMVPWLLPF